jgi:lipoprotein-releasing system permease protein
MSVAVISVVVWLLLVFLSVTEGIERNWVHKLTALSGSIRIQPTARYFSSYYYQIDQYAQASNYALKTIRQKALAERSDPYSPDDDAELPAAFPAFDVKDPVKQLYGVLQSLPSLAFQDYEVSGALLRLQLAGHQLLTQMSYLASFPDKNPHLNSLLLSAPASQEGTPIFLARQFQDNGVRVGDRGHLSYPSMTSSGMQEQRFAVFVAGFYDGGLLAMSSKYILVPPKVTETINASSSPYSIDKTVASGVALWFDGDADAMKKQIEARLQEEGIDAYWKVATYKDYETAKELLLQFQSDKYLFTLIGIIVLAACCSNIISMLILLVQNKKKEIGILQAMGASKKSIALIFGSCGAAIGLVSCALGVALAYITLHNIDAVVAILSRLQGHDAFNALFYGQSLPSALSHRALYFVLIATPLLALGAALIPALKACRLQPSQILRSE